MPSHKCKHSRLAAVFIFVICISACASDNSPRTGGHSRANAIIERGTNKVYRRGGNYSLQTHAPAAAPVTPAAAPPAATESNEERSQKIAKAVTGLKAIKSASVVITGNTAIVGVQTDSMYAGAALIDIKRIVEEKVKSTDKGIDHVSVTTAADLVGRINRMPDAGASEDTPLSGKPRG